MLSCWQGMWLVTMSPSRTWPSDVYWYFSRVIPVATVLILLVMLLIMISQHFPRFAIAIIVNTTLVLMFYVLYVFLDEPKEVYE